MFETRMVKWHCTHCQQSMWRMAGPLGRIAIFLGLAGCDDWRRIRPDPFGR